MTRPQSIVRETGEVVKGGSEFAELREAWLT